MVYMLLVHSIGMEVELQNISCDKWITGAHNLQLPLFPHVAQVTLCPSALSAKDESTVPVFP